MTSFAAEPTKTNGIDENIQQSENLRRIRTKLDQLHTTDVDFQVFGASAHRYHEAPALNDAALHRQEETLGVALPDEFRTFLKYVHGGGPGPGYGLQFGITPASPELAGRPFPYDNRAVAAFLARSLADRAALLPLTPETDQDNEWPPRWGFVGLAHLGCDIYSGIVVAGEQRGLIWTCADSGWVPETNGDSQLGFLRWYEAWLDKSLAQSENR